MRAPRQNSLKPAHSVQEQGSFPRTKEAGESGYGVGDYLHMQLGGKIDCVLV